MPACVCGRDPWVQAFEEEDLPIHQRRRVLTWASSRMGSLPRPLLGSSEMGVMLEDAHLLEKDAELLYEQIKGLRREAELLKEQAYQKRVLCAPIRSLPPETLSQILVLATPKSFAFRAEVRQNDAHPLSAVCRAWRDTVKTTPAIWSRINILLSSSYYREREWQDVQRRLPAWLARAGSTGLKIAFEWAPFAPSSAAVQSVWVMLLSLVGNWREFSYLGPSSLLNQFWENSHSALRLETATLQVVESPTLTIEEIGGSKTLAFNLNALPKLQELSLRNYLPLKVISDQLPFATQLHTLTLRSVQFSEKGLAGIAAFFPFVTRLHLVDIVRQSLVVSTSQTVAFQRLERFELSGVKGPREHIALPALEGCRALKSLRLQYDAFVGAEEPRTWPSVERLELELPGYVDADPIELGRLLTMLPSLKSLKASPPNDSSWGGCETRTLLGTLISGHAIGTTLCPELLEVIFWHARISRRDLVSFIEGRTWNAEPEALEDLEKYCGDWWDPDPDRDTRFAKWKPTCVATTTNCFRTPDMVNAGLQVLVDSMKSGRLSLYEPDPEDRVECDTHCNCDCGDEDCDCCEHRGSDDGNDGNFSDYAAEYYGYV